MAAPEWAASVAVAGGGLSCPTARTTGRDRSSAAPAPVARMIARLIASLRSFQAKVGKDLRVGFVLRQHGVTRAAVLGDRRAVGALVAVVVTAEAAGKVLVADVVGVGAPAHLHVGKHVAAVDLLQRAGRGLDLPAVRAEGVRVLLLVERRQVPGDAARRRLAVRVLRAEQLDPL